MKDTFLNHNIDKMLLFALVLLAGWSVFFTFRYEGADAAARAWAENAFSTALGALLLLLTGRSNRADGQTANGLPADVPKPPAAQELAK